MSSDDVDNVTMNNSDEIIQKPLLTSKERLSKIRDIIEAFESGDLQFDFDDAPKPSDTPLTQYLKATAIIEGAGVDMAKTKVKIIDNMSLYERVILGMVDATPETITDAINKYYDLFSRLRKADRIKGTYASFDQKQKITEIKNNVTTLQNQVNQIDNTVQGIIKDLER